MKQGELVANTFVFGKFKKDQQALLLSAVKWSSRKQNRNKIRIVVIGLHPIWIYPGEKNRVGTSISKAIGMLLTVGMFLTFSDSSVELSIVIYFGG